MKKKSPLKVDDGNNGSINYTSYSKNEHYSKNDRTNRFDLLLKNHGKCTTLNQMILDLFRLDQPKSLYISYYLYRAIEKEITSLCDSLKKESYSDSNDPFREFKSIVEKELENVKLNLLMMKECIEDEGEYKTGELEGHRSEVLRGYLEGVRLVREEEMILILQVVDYLEESILIKKDAY